MEVTHEMARTMAQWWGDQIRGDAHHDNGDHDNLASVFAGILADSMNKQADESQADKFVNILTEKILEQSKKNPYTLRHLLDCDYGPSKFLSDAAKEAGISPNNFPWKTCMGILEKDDGTVDIQVSAGYRAPWIKIWPKEGEAK
jgi:hypothetical protein